MPYLFKNEEVVEEKEAISARFESLRKANEGYGSATPSKNMKSESARQIFPRVESSPYVEGVPMTTAAKSRQTRECRFLTDDDDDTAASCDDARTGAGNVERTIQRISGVAD